jgi:hypothetical protein
LVRLVISARWKEDNQRAPSPTRASLLAIGLCVCTLASCGGDIGQVAPSSDGGHTTSMRPDATKDAGRHPPPPPKPDAGSSSRSDAGTDAAIEAAAPAVACAPGQPACTGVCVSGRCLVTLYSEDPAAAIAVDETDIYWTAWATPSALVIKEPLGGGTATTLALGAECGGCGIAVNSTNVYWTNADGSLATLSLNGGSPNTLAAPAVPGIFFSGARVALDETNAYWANGAGVMTIPLVGGTQRMLAADPHAFGIAVDASSVYWTDIDQKGHVMKVPIAGGAPTTLAASSCNAPDLAIDSTSAYWVNESTFLMKVPLAGGAAVTLATGYPRALEGVAVDSTNVYWSDGTGALVKTPVAGGETITLVTFAQFDQLDQLSPSVIVVDGTSVYWSNKNATMQIAKLTPK